LREPVLSARSGRSRKGDWVLTLTREAAERVCGQTPVGSPSRGLLQERVDEARKVASVKPMSRDSGACGPLDWLPVNVTSRIAKGLTSRRRKLRRSSAASRPLHTAGSENTRNPWLFVIENSGRKQVGHWRRRLPSDHMSPSRRAGKAQKSAVSLTETLAFRQIVQDPLVVHKPEGCLMSLVFTRGARSHADWRASTKVGSPPCRHSVLIACCITAAAMSQ
jgi:hypothetical protein